MPCQKVKEAMIDRLYFVHRGRNIYTMWDPPHLIKNVQNNLKKHGFVQDGKDILWSYVDNFYTADSSKPIRIATRLTKRHIETSSLLSWS